MKFLRLDSHTLITSYQLCCSHHFFFIHTNFALIPKKITLHYCLWCELSEMSRKFASVAFRVSMKSQLIKLLREIVITHLMTRQRFWSCQRENQLVKSLFRERVTWKCIHKVFGLSCESRQVCSIEQTLSKSFSYLKKNKVIKKEEGKTKIYDFVSHKTSFPYEQFSLLLSLCLLCPTSDFMLQ